MKNIILVLLIALSFALLAGCAGAVQSLVGGGISIFGRMAGNAIVGAVHDKYVLTDEVQHEDFPALSDCDSLGANVWICMDRGAATGDVFAIIPTTTNRYDDVKQLRKLSAAVRKNLKEDYVIKRVSDLRSAPIMPNSKMVYERYRGKWFVIGRK